MSEFKSVKSSSDTDLRAMKWLIWGGSLVTLAFWANLNDPFNAPKSWILSITGFWLIGWLAFQVRNQWHNPTLKRVTVIAFAYLVTLSVAFLETDNKYIGFFGEYQRRTGYLSYLCLIAFFLSACYLFNLRRLDVLEKASLAVGSLIGVYGFVQHYNFDFVHWNNPYNSVLSTLGNPDFAAASMAIFLVLNFGLAIQKKYVVWARVIAGFNVVLLSIVIQFSQARQGLLAGMLGVALVLIVWIHQRSSWLGKTSFALLLMSAFLAMAGMLNKGSLATYLYKPSLTLRGDYWRAGWQMFLHHPLFGVGLDRYGANFRQYRDSTRVLRQGPDLVSNAAHNVFLQLASTGGIFVAVAFFAFTGYVFWRGLRALRTTQGSNQVAVAVIFSAWLVYEAQSIISIDNLGIAIWGYILGGVVVGISSDIQPYSKLGKFRISILQPLISSFLALALLSVSALFFGAESSMKTLNSEVASPSKFDATSFERIIYKPLSYVFVEPSFAVMVAGDLAQANKVSGAILNLQNIISNDPRNYDAQELLARIYEFQGNRRAAVQVRRNMTRIDPLNQKLLDQIKVDETGQNGPKQKLS